MTNMKVKALAPWFGGKRTLAPEIVAELGPHTQYFEPFCGSMAVLFAKEPSQKETVNDLHGGLVCLARVVADGLAAPQLFNRLQTTMFSEDLLEQAADRLDSWEMEPAWLLCDDRHGENPGYRRADANMLEFAYWYFLACWMGRNGTAGTERLDYQIAVRWTKGGGSPTVRWKNAVDSLPAWHERLRNVVILRRDAFKILNRFEDVAGTAIYVDAPYMRETRSNGSPKSGGGGRYLHDFEDKSPMGRSLFPDACPDDDNKHNLLAGILRSYREARVVVSYYDCPRVRRLYEGWTFIDKTRQKHLHAQNGRGARPKEAPEILIINGPSFTEPDLKPASLAEGGLF